MLALDMDKYLESVEEAVAFVFLSSLKDLVQPIGSQTGMGDKVSLA
jgi:hypothetical protein